MNKKQPSIEQNSGYSCIAGTQSAKNGMVEYALVTDKGQGFVHYENGNYDEVVNGTSKEVCGHNITNSETPAKVIIAKNGDIHIECKLGDISLIAKNIRLNASNEISINAGKITSLKAPTVTTTGSMVSIAADNSFTATGTHASLFGHLSCDVNDGPSIDESSVMSKLLHIIDQVKKFFTSICAD